MTDTSADLVQLSQESLEENPGDAKQKMSGDKSGRRTGKRGRRPSKVDVKVKLEKSRQSARECRARKKLRYQYLEELVNNREKAVLGLREELEQCKVWCEQIDKGIVPEGVINMIQGAGKVFRSPGQGVSTAHQYPGGATNMATPLSESTNTETPYEILMDVVGAPRVPSTSGISGGGALNLFPIPHVNLAPGRMVLHQEQPTRATSSNSFQPQPGPSGYS